MCHVVAGRGGEVGEEDGNIDGRTGDEVRREVKAVGAGEAVA